MSGKGFDLTCDGGEGHPILLGALAAIPPDYCVRVEYDDGEVERVGDYRIRRVEGSDVHLTPWSDDNIPARSEFTLFVGDIRAVTIY